MKDIFERQTAEEIVSRIEKLRPDNKPLWGKMSAAQMLAHCNVTYELVYDNKHRKPGRFKRFLLRLFVKDVVVGPKPYKRESPTAPEFMVSGERDFESEKRRLIGHIRDTQSRGRAWFEGKESHSFGVLNAGQWNNMFYKHLDHHLQQFGV